jgi:hypothetical protein
MQRDLRRRTDSAAMPTGLFPAMSCLGGIPMWSPADAGETAREYYATTVNLAMLVDFSSGMLQNEVCM